MAYFDINTRADRVNRMTVPVNTGTFYTGRWISIDSNGYAAYPTAKGSRNVWLVILGNDTRPDSLGSSSVTVQYGQNLYTLNTYGQNDTTTLGALLAVSTVGDLYVTTTQGIAVAIAMNAKNRCAAGQKIRTLL
jgi:hypothetical protein